MSSPTTIKRYTSPPACPECGGKRIAFRFRAFSWAIGIMLRKGHWPSFSIWRVPFSQPACPACGGAGQVPAKLASIADPKRRREALEAYCDAGRWN